jgi:holliday junction DNA helicase RuvA
MIHSVSGKLTEKHDTYIVIEVSGIGFRIFFPEEHASRLPSVGDPIHMFSYLHVREDALELYGFLTEAELSFFEKLISVSGIGPKSAQNILAVAPIDRLIAAINEGKAELLTKASGIGRKTADRIILELKGKIEIRGAKTIVGLMESDQEIEETLVSLGYSRADAKSAVSKINPRTQGFKDRLKEALRNAKR